MEEDKEYWKEDSGVLKRKEFWTTFCAERPDSSLQISQTRVVVYDTETCFDSLWHEDRINSLLRCREGDDVLYLIYLLNRKADITVRTPFGNAQSFKMCNLVKQETVLGPLLNHCSLHGICMEGQAHNMGTVEIKAVEFVNDIADRNNGYLGALKSNQIISSTQALDFLCRQVQNSKNQ